jgi:hypothetical protein
VPTGIPVGTSHVVIAVENRCTRPGAPSHAPERPHIQDPQSLLEGSYADRLGAQLPGAQIDCIRTLNMYLRALMRSCTGRGCGPLPTVPTESAIGIRCCPNPITGGCATASTTATMLVRRANPVSRPTARRWCTP